VEKVLTAFFGRAAMKERRAKLRIATKEKKGRGLVLERVFNAPLEKVWQAWAEPENFKLWWGPRDYTCPAASIEFVEGGKFLACMRSSEGKDFWSTGTYRKIDPHSRITYVDSFSDDKGNPVPPTFYDMPGKWGREVVVDLKFEREGLDKTRLTLHHTGLPKGLMTTQCGEGWNQSFDKLEGSVKITLREAA
jgi:uncharacterized protein YndB with AHSA1/START domain